MISPVQLFLSRDPEIACIPRVPQIPLQIVSNKRKCRDQQSSGAHLYHALLARSLVVRHLIFLAINSNECGPRTSKQGDGEDNTFLCEMDSKHSSLPAPEPNLSSSRRDFFLLSFKSYSRVEKNFSFQLCKVMLECKERVSPFSTVYRIQHTLFAHF